MMNSDCENCSSWEEQMYWKHFNSMHFYQILSTNFHDHLVLPEKFAAHMKTHVPDKVSLIGPTGTVWNIDVKKTDTLLLVGDGWKNFVKTYELEENCLLMFKYKRNVSFEVLIFDQESFCEKEASYFVKICQHSKSEHANHKKRIVRECSSTEVIEDDNDYGSDFVVSKKSKKDVAGEINCLERENTQNPRNQKKDVAGEINCLERENTQNPRNETSNASIKKGRRGRPRRMVITSNSRSKSKAQSEKQQHGIDVAIQGLNQTSPRDITTPEKAKTFPKNDHFNKSNYQVGKYSAAKLAKNDHSSKSKDQTGGNDIAPGMSPIFGSDIAQDISPISGRDITQELSPISGRDWSNPEDEDDSSEMNHPHIVKSLSGKEPSGNGSAKKISQHSSGEAIIVNFKDDSRNSTGKRGRPKRQAVTKPAIKQASRSAIKNKSYPEVVSNRRPVTEMEKMDALQRAKANLEQTENGFIVVLPPSSVYRRFYVSIPAEWMNKNLTLQRQNIDLQVEDKIWHTKFYCNDKRSVGGLCAGWKAFSVDNSLEESDVLLFKLADQTDDATVLFNVDIFRVIPTILPPP